MSTAENKVRQEGYRYTGIYETNKEKLKQRAEQERAKGFLVRTIDYSLFAKYKPLKGAELENAKASYKEANLNLSANKHHLNDLQTQLLELQTKIANVNNKIYVNQCEIGELVYKLKDSGVRAVEIAESVN